jgi:hypothetical protein
MLFSVVCLSWPLFYPLKPRSVLELDLAPNVFASGFQAA